MRLADFDYDLPSARIAQAPPARRDTSRLMVVERRSGDIRHARFADLPALLRRGDRLVLNDTRVLPCRLYGVREGHTGKVELLLLNPGAGGPRFTALARPARKLVPGTVVHLGETSVTVVEAPDATHRVVAFPEGFDTAAFLRRAGHMPLPPYIRRPDGDADRERYQTVFAAVDGAVAAPTAGLHFTPELLDELAEAGVARTRITLHVGAGTFTPVTAEDPRNHVMESESYSISGEAAREIQATRKAGGRIVAVGTTAVRTLESAGRGRGAAWRLPPGADETRLFIYPPYEFHGVDALVTNFHLPRSTLLMLVSAFAGTDLIRRAYQVAIAEEYRFYSYGDAMLIL